MPDEKPGPSIGSHQNPSDKPNSTSDADRKTDRGGSQDKGGRESGGQDKR